MPDLQRQTKASLCGQLAGWINSWVGTWWGTLTLLESAKSLAEKTPVFFGLSFTGSSLAAWSLSAQMVSFWGVSKGGAPIVMRVECVGMKIIPRNDTQIMLASPVFWIYQDRLIWIVVFLFLPRLLT
jgi:hypothetical protein